LTTKTKCVVHEDGGRKRMNAYHPSCMMFEEFGNTTIEQKKIKTNMNNLRSKPIWITRRRWTTPFYHSY